MMTGEEYDPEKYDKERILRMISEFNSHMEVLRQAGRNPDKMSKKRRLAEFIEKTSKDARESRDYEKIYSKSELSVLPDNEHKFNWGTPTERLSDAEKWRRHVAQQSSSSRISSIGHDSDAIQPVPKACYDERGRFVRRIVAASTKQHENEYRDYVNSVVTAYHNRLKRVHKAVTMTPREREKQREREQNEKEKRRKQRDDNDI